MKASSAYSTASSIAALITDSNASVSAALSYEASAANQAGVFTSQAQSVMNSLYAATAGEEAGNDSALALNLGIMNTYSASASAYYAALSNANVLTKNTKSLTATSASYYASSASTAYSYLTKLASQAS